MAKGSQGCGLQGQGRAQSTLKGPLITKFSKLSGNTEDINQSTPSEIRRALKAHEKDGAMIPEVRLDQVSSGEAQPSSGLLWASILVGFPRSGRAGQFPSEWLLHCSLVSLRIWRKLRL